MGFFVKLLVNALAVIISAYLIGGVSVDSILTAIIVALVLGLLNSFVKPILVILTLPITILTLGLFYLVLNVIMIYIADYFIGGFRVDGFLPALFFSIVLALVGWILDRIF
jgi:putative membrane protein